MGAQEYDYLANLRLEYENVSSLLGHVDRLFDYLITEKRGAEKKYAKLLDLHNKLIESTRGSGEHYSAEYIYKLADDNEHLTLQLSQLRAAKLYRIVETVW
jgi:hypothetical protein